MAGAWRVPGRWCVLFVAFIFAFFAALPSARAACTSPAAVEGAREWIEADKQYRICRGTSWVPVSTASMVPTTGLIAWLRFDETSGTTATDSSGNGNHGTLYNFPASPWRPTGGAVGGALEFDGVNDYVALANESNFDFTPASTFSFSLWFYRDTDHTEDDLIEKVGSGYRGYALWMEEAAGCGGGGGCVRFDFRGDNYFVLETQGGSVVPGQWYHVVMTYDGTGAAGMRIYLNGVNQTLAWTGVSNVTGNTLNNIPFTIGSDPQDPGCCNMDGRIDDVRVYNVALTQQNVTDLYNNTCPVASLIQYNPTTHRYAVCNGGAWEEVTCPGANCGALGACGKDGAVDYFSASKEMAWCDGGTWRVMAR